MSDEFIRIATEEINQEIQGITELLQSCKDDNDILKYGNSIEKHTHKIKGLAPMMGKENIGRLAALLDNLLKHTMKGNLLDGIFDILNESNDLMKDSMTNPNSNTSMLEEKIKNNFSEVLS